MLVSSMVGCIHRMLVGCIYRMLVGCICAASGACASGGERSPSEVTRAQIAWLEAGDEGAALALLTPEARVKAPMWPARGELPSPESVVESERTALWAGERELELVRTASGWAIRRGVLSLFRADSPEGALAAFGRALEAGDVGLMLGLLPEESRRLQHAGRLAAAIAARAAAWRELGRAIAAGRVVWGERAAERAEAVVTVSEGADTRPPAARERRLVLVREATGWKVFDVLPWSEYIGP